jgi:hypothetical protein
MRRREFITLLGGAAAAAWPLAARAQQREPMRRIGVLMNTAADDPESLARVTAFAQGLQELGWIDGRNVRIDYRWGAADVDRIRRYAEELVALAPHVIVSSGTPSVAALQWPCRFGQTVKSTAVVRSVRPWVRQPHYGTVVASVTLGTVIATSAVPTSPSFDLCWYWSNSSKARGYWDFCQ